MLDILEMLFFFVVILLFLFEIVSFASKLILLQASEIFKAMSPTVNLF